MRIAITLPRPGEPDVIVTGDYEPAQADARDEPGWPAEFVPVSCVGEDGTAYLLTEDELAQVCELAGAA